MRILHIGTPAWREIFGNTEKELMKISFVDNQPSVEQFQNWLTNFGEYLVTRNPEEDYDFIICWGVTRMEEAERALAMHPNVPLINYNWDIYEWAVKTPRKNEYDYRRYVKFLTRGAEVWCPSNSVAMRTKQWIKEWERIDDFPTHIIKSHGPIYDDPISDAKFVFNTQRRNPDERLDWFERACDELKIPYKSSNHTMERNAYRKAMAECSFQVSAYYEMSTGGLGILEGYYLGKPVLLSNSKWQGGGEYMGDRATYFQHDDFEDLKRKIKDMWDNPDKYKVDIKDARKWLKKNYSEKALAKRIHDRLQWLSKKKQ